MKKPKQIALLLVIALLAVGAYACYNQIKVSEQKKKIARLVSDVGELEQKKEELQEKVDDLEDEVDDLNASLSRVQHFDQGGLSWSRPAISSSGVAFTGSAYETQIDGDFEGWEGETIFKMMDGSIWQQASYDYMYHYSFMPRVLIYSKGGSTYMKVEDVEDVIEVRRLN